MTNELTERISEMLREKNEEIAALRGQLYNRDMEITRLNARLKFGVNVTKGDEPESFLDWDLKKLRERLP